MTDPHRDPFLKAPNLAYLEGLRAEFENHGLQNPAWREAYEQRRRELTTQPVTFATTPSNDASTSLIEAINKVSTLAGLHELVKVVEKRFPPTTDSYKLWHDAYVARSAALGERVAPGGDTTRLDGYLKQTPLGHKALALKGKNHV